MSVRQGRWDEAIMGDFVWNLVLLRTVLVAKEKKHQLYTSEVLDDSFLVTVMLNCCVIPVPSSYK